MGYECPVCGGEEADGEHLANHLAFTALVRGGDHEDWLDDRVPDWEERDPESLAPEVTERATETETEPTTEPRDRTHDHDVPVDDPESVGRRAGRNDRSGEAADVLEEARELTEEMYATDDGEGDGATEDGDGASDDGDDSGSRDDDSESE